MTPRASFALAGLIASGPWLAAGCTMSATSAQAASLVEEHRLRGKVGIVILEVKAPSGDSLRFVLDTGSSLCVVDPLFSGRFGISASTTTEQQGGGGVFKSDVADEPVALAVPAGSVNCAQTLVADLSGVDFDGIRLAGVIGGDFFHHRIVGVDFDGRTVVVHDRGTYQQPAGGTIVPIRIEKNRPYIKARLSVQGGAQDVAVELLVDTGSLDHVAHPLIRESKGKLTQITTTGLGPGSASVAGTWRNAQIGPHSFDEVPGNGGQVSILGDGILAKFNLVFDHEGGWMMLRPRKT